jgi:23S rRNA (uracil1939-C5)-methyltransferase
MGRRQRKKYPVELTEASIHGLSHEGRGIAIVAEKTIFISNALPEEEVIFKYTGMLSKYAEGQAQEIIKASPERVEPKCEFFGMCGGCSLQHMRHSSQIEVKQNALLELFAHVGNVEPQEVLPPLTGPLYQYRHKARLGVRFVTKKETVLVGFRELQSRYLAQIDRCVILNPSVGELIMPLRELIQKLSIFEQIAQIEVAIGDEQTSLIFRNLVELAETDSQLLCQFAEQHKLIIFMQPGKPKSIYKLWPQNGDDYLFYRHPDFNLTFWFYPTDFTQVNPEINRKMVKNAIDYLDLQPTDKVLDLFCGLGNFTLPISTKAGHVVGVEGSQEMVARASMNATRNNISNTEFFMADLFEDISQQAWAQQQYDKLLIDPARSGAAEIIPYIAKWKPTRIVYISCNPATLARDSGEIIKLGYQLEKAGIIDMFPQTNHVESIAVFTLTGK